jgi:hypothetical protein
VEDNMYLHLGGDLAILVKDVIAIIDVNLIKRSKITEEFFKMAEEEGFVVNNFKEEPKSIIIAEINKKSKVFLSPISSVTLNKRTEFIKEISNV